MTGIILSGGKSSRIGENKAFVVIDGMRIIDRAVNLFKSLFEDVIIVTNAPLDYLDLEVTLVTDIYAGKHALGGIYTGLFYASCSHAFVAACDMPHLNPQLIAMMIKQAPAYDIVVPETKAGLEPLHAIYSKNCLPHIKRRIVQDRLKITGFYKGLKCLRLPETVCRSFDDKMLSFTNINTLEGP